MRKIKHMRSKYITSVIIDGCIYLTCMSYCNIYTYMGCRISINVSLNGDL